MCTMEREDAALRVAPASGVGMAALGSATETRARQAQLRATEPIGRHGQVPEGVAFLGVNESARRPFTCEEVLNVTLPRKQSARAARAVP